MYICTVQYSNVASPTFLFHELLKNTIVGHFIVVSHTKMILFCVANASVKYSYVVSSPLLFCVFPQGARRRADWEDHCRQ